MTFDASTIIGMLPALYRTRDEEQGGDLSDVLSVVADQLALLVLGYIDSAPTGTREPYRRVPVRRSGGLFVMIFTP